MVLLGLADAKLTLHTVLVDVDGRMDQQCRLAQEE